jgi:SAM-dependent methyltransferase
MGKQRRFSDRGVARGRIIIRQFLRKTGRINAVLDVGCGTGGDLITAGELFPGARLYGIEMATSGAVAQETSGARIYSINAEREPFPLANESVDVVLSNQFLEHTRELFWILHESSRVLKTGGHLIVGVPNLASLHNRLLLLLGFQPTSINNCSDHVRGFTRRDMAAFLNKCFTGGYVLTDFKGSGFYPFPRRVADALSAALPSMAVRMFLMFRKTAAYNREFLEYPLRHQLGRYFFTGPRD